MGRSENIEISNEILKSLTPNEYSVLYFLRIGKPKSKIIKSTCLTEEIILDTYDSLIKKDYLFFDSDSGDYYLTTKSLDFFRFEEDWFNEFWLVYPKKTGKENAKSEFKRHVMKGGIKAFDEIMNGLKSHIEYRIKRRNAGKFVPDMPYPKKFLQSKMYLDELPNNETDIEFYPSATMLCDQYGKSADFEKVKEIWFGFTQQQREDCYFNVLPQYCAANKDITYRMSVLNFVLSYQRNPDFISGNQQMNNGRGLY